MVFVKMVFLLFQPEKSFLLRLLKSKNDAENKCQRYQDAVPVDLEITDLKSNRINVELYSEARKLHFFMIDKIHIALPCVKGLE